MMTNVVKRKLVRKGWQKFQKGRKIMAEILRSRRDNKCGEEIP